MRLIEPRRSGRRGLSLVEVLIAMAVLTIGLLGLMASLLASTTYVQLSEARTVATNHARDLMERLLAADETGESVAVGMIELWEAIQAGEEPPPPISLPEQRYTVKFFDPSDPRLPARPTELTQEAMVGRLAPITVEVTVTWRQGQRPMRVRLTRIVNPDRV